MENKNKYIPDDFESVKEGPKFIRTANGPKEKELFINTLTLPYEHICQNLCDFLLENK